MDASDPKQVRKANKAAKAAGKQRESVVHNLMSTIAGRAFVHDILDGCHAFASSFSLNALQMAFSEGERNVGLKLLTDIMRVCPDYYVLMMREYSERNTDDSDRERPSGDSSGEHSGGEDAGGGTQGGNGTTVNPDAPDPHGYYR